MTEDGKIESLATTLRTQIKNGDFGTKGRLPSVTQIAKAEHVGRSTVYLALQILQSEGLVLVKGNSFYVNTAIHITTTPTPTFEQVLTAQGAQPYVQNIGEPTAATMPPDIAAMFGQSPGAQYIHRYRVQGKADIPMRLSEYWYPHELADAYLQQMRDDPAFDTLEAIKADLGITHQLVHDDVLSRIPTKEEAALLSIPRNSPVQEVRRTNRTVEGTILMHHRIVFVGPYSILGYDYELRAEKS